MRALVDRGAPVSANDLHGFTPLMYATMRNNAAAVKVLINAGASTDIAAVSGSLLRMCDHSSYFSHGALHNTARLV